MKSVLTVLFIAALCVAASAQDLTVSGAVVDSTTGAGLRNANVVLIHLPDSTRKGASTGADGSFTVTDLTKGRYLLRITYIGYKPTTRNIQLADQPLKLGKIQLRESSVKMGNVDIEGQLPVAVVKGDTTEVNAGSFKVNKDATAEDLVTKIPGVTVQSGTVQHQGEAVKKTLVDGKPFFGNDPTAALRNIPADIIDKIQMFDQQSEQSRFTGIDDGNTTKTMNIITRQGARNGVFGKAIAGYGASDADETGVYKSGEYKSGVTVNWFDNDRRVTLLGISNNVNEQNFAIEDIVGASGGGGFGGMGGQALRVLGAVAGGGGGRGFGMMGGGGFGGGDVGNFLVQPRGGIAKTHAMGLNYADKWGTDVDVSGSYFLNYSDNDAQSSLFRQYVLSSNASQTYGEATTAGTLNTNHRLNMRIDWTIDTLNSILVTPRLTLQRNTGHSLLNGVTMMDGAMLNTTNIDRGTNLHGLSFSNDVLWRHKFETRGRTFSIGASQGVNNNTGDGTQLSNFRVFGIDTSLTALDQISDLNKKGWSLGANTAYTEPVSDKMMLQLNYNVNQSRNESDKNTWNKDGLGVYDQLDTALTNKFQNRYTTHAVGSDLRLQDGDINASVGLQYQLATLTGDQQFPYVGDISKSFRNVMPNAQFRWRFSKEKNFNLFYRTRTSAPSVDQLQNVIDNSNPLQLRMGNPDLQQDYSHNMNMRFTSSNFMQMTYFFAMIGGSYSFNSIGNSTYTADKDTTLVFGDARVPLVRGGQLTRSENIDGQYSMRTMITYGFPFDVLKTNVNLSLFGNLSRTPGRINNVTNYSTTPSVGASVVFASNISPEVDYTVSSLSIYSDVRNSLRSELNTNTFQQNTRVKLNWTFWEGFVITSDLTHTVSNGQTASFNQNFVMWNLGLGKKFLPNDAAEIRFSVFDVLNQNVSTSRTSNELYIEDNRVQVLRRYLLLSFSYTLRSFTGGFAKEADRERDHRDGPPPMMR
jgi:hypothetical protein